MKTVLLKNCTTILPGEKLPNTNVLIKAGKIAAISNEEFPADEVLDLENRTLFAGFIDIHNHGAVGVDVNGANAEALQTVGQFLAENGVTAWMPTFVPDSDETYRKVVGAIEEVIEIQNDLPVAQIVGVHYEGVFANEQMCGALRPEFFKTFSGRELNDLPTLHTGVHLTTFAPEIEGGIELVRELRKQNWIPSIGHTRADLETLEKAFDAGAMHVTHLFNAMTGVHHRDLGVAGWALTKDEIFCEIIADGVHVHPKMLKFAQKNKPPGKLLLVSDSVAPTGLGDGHYELWGERVEVVGGKTRNERGSIAGSVITLLDAVKMYLSLGVSASDVSKMASANPAKLLGLEKTRGSIEVGMRADLVALDKERNVKMSLINGKFAFRDF
ncbi:MAG TPA: N-acetylglucosamine-6-phosphate deacetylase [Pyrinomonadaceae bacterium]|nr:N-acetylglucosamine-6-phosphate deacetylase [Pyrinomonadaceae bacterium]